MKLEIPETRAEVLAFLRANRNWGRWSDDDELGTLNLITADSVRAAAASVREGRSISLARAFPSRPSEANTSPAQHLVLDRVGRGEGGTVIDYIGISCHGIASTHLDAINHVWDEDGMWGGRNPDDVIHFDGVRWAGIDGFGDGIVTRAHLFDVPAHRGTEYVDYEAPVHGTELNEIAERRGMDIRPGDAVVVYSGRERWSEKHGEYGRAVVQTQRGLPSTTEPRPGLHASCLWYLRSVDCSLLAWDMMDLTPNGLDLAWAVHAAIWAFGLPLIDNSLLEPLALACRESDRTDFMLTVAPLKIEGGTGCPVNPVAVL